MSSGRLETGTPWLDAALGGGLLPGTLTIVAGATGVGKTQLGIRWWSAGNRAPGNPAPGNPATGNPATGNSATGNSAKGAIIDLSSRGDSQNHAEYAKRLGSVILSDHPPRRMACEAVFDGTQPLGHRMALLGYEGKRVLRSQMDPDAWDAWQSQMNRRAPAIMEFIYRHRIRGTERFLVDGIEPLDDPTDSLQLDMLELIYHRMLRLPHDWLARELFRQDFRRMEPQVDSHAYEPKRAAMVVLLTTRETMLDQLLSKPWSDGDLAAGANTIILMGRVMGGVDSRTVGRALHIAKHRGSACDDSILPFSIHPEGLRFAGQAGAS
jgi:hypothetical protein